MNDNSHGSPVVAKPIFAVLLIGWWALPWWTHAAGPARESPLEPIDTSSPRTTFQGFIEFMNHASGTGYGLLQSYLASSRLFPSESEVETMGLAIHHLESAERTLDLSGMPPALARDSARPIAIQLKEILDRLDLPSAESIPDAAAMAGTEFKRWTLPTSEIRIQRVATGPRAGEYLFSPETVHRIPQFYAKVKDLPYKPGATAGWYEFTSYSPGGVALALRHVIPPRWVLDVPRWAQAKLFDQPVWRWLGIAAVLGAALIVVLGLFRLSRHWAKRTTLIRHWVALLKPISLVMVTPALGWILGEILRISGTAYQVASLSLWTVFYLSLTWLVWVAGSAVAESLIAQEKLRISSIDSQMIRLVLRLVTVIAAVFIVVAGADRVGLPSYSVIAGLGVGGLAVALAGQQTLANLLGSLIIMFEKPFAIGHWIKVKDIEGVVEDVGFRSTRIRTFYGSLVTIPSSELVSRTVDNMERREYRRVRTVLNLTYDTPRGKIEGFVEGVRQILESHPDTRKDNMQVVFHDFGAHSLDILVYFFLKVPNWSAELIKRQQIFLEILRLAETQGVRFAFPTQTLHIASPSGELSAIGTHAAPFEEDPRK